MAKQIYTAREALRTLDKWNDEIEKLLMQVEELHALATSCTVSSEKENVQSSGSKDKMCSIVSKIVDLQSLIDSRIDGYSDLKKQVQEVIFEIQTESYQNILYDKYIMHHNGEEIMNEYYLSYENYKKIKQRATKVFEQIYDSRFGE